MPETALRIDRLLFFLRIAKSRNVAQGWAESGFIRVNGRRIEKGSATVGAGDVITMPRGEAVLTFKLIVIPMRRGPAPEAKACYQILN
jgi:ribosome-associated heat shock protein Hsp15